MPYFLFGILLLIPLLPFYIKRDLSKPHDLLVLNRFIIGFLFFVLAAMVLPQIAREINVSRVVNCSPEKIFHDSTFGDQCFDDSVNPLGKTVANVLSLGAPFGNLLLAALALFITTIFSIIGFTKEILDKKRRDVGIRKAFWSTSFLTILALISLFVKFILNLHLP